MTKPEITAVMANRLQRFIPDRQNAEGMADALQEDLAELGYVIFRRGTSCPFDGACKLKPEEPCPVCGDIGTDPDAPVHCIGY